MLWFSGWQIACIERWLWWPLCLQSSTTTSLEQPWLSVWFCLLPASFVWLILPPQPICKHRGLSMEVTGAVTQKQDFLGLGDHWVSQSFWGHWRVVRRSQHCVKMVLVQNCSISSAITMKILQSCTKPWTLHCKVYVWCFQLQYFLAGHGLISGWYILVLSQVTKIIEKRWRMF